MSLIVFDLDGTLVDTAPDLLATLDHILGRHGLPPAPRERIMPCISRGARAMIEEGLKLSGRKVAPKELDRLLEVFLAHYEEHICVESRPFPGLVSTLDTLEAEGWSFAVCTNKRVGMSKLLLDQLGLLNRFRAVLGADSVAKRKPDPAHLLETIEAAGGKPDAALMVGDSAADIAAARAAFVPVIGVPFGYTTKPMAELRPDVIIDSYSQLTPALAARLLETRGGSAAVE
ncbi:phosphoglycolate phosphatase [Afifella sp. JA880]|uniref:phosphoglycolate phosphatase n=1 Tax=Afifella sp. JA880 TaxID=2975280 RepID=UPI0021BA573A|nr:phosphoglycolate phosphatase [Afifella sp. JA880]MCT8266593.1 phosphoglycolate phosphatase [Afifella sp. JA880]